MKASVLSLCDRPKEYIRPCTFSMARWHSIICDLALEKFEIEWKVSLDFT
jgi:hypothetical protein